MLDSSLENLEYRRPSIFEKIVRLEPKKAANVPSGHQRAKWQPSVEECVGWLEKRGLTRTGRSYQSDPSRDPASLLSPGNPITLGIPSHRAERKSKAELDYLKKHHTASQGSPPTGELLDKLWRELKDPAGAVRTLDIQRLPADALAFYRPFHFSPLNEWGIYIMVEHLLEHCRRLYHSFGGGLAAFNLETLLGCVLFEVFHHEFFHHLTECAATTIEIASASFGQPKPIFNDYWNCRFQGTAGIGAHPDHPLEEALANAYAYNSFSFLARTQIGYKVLWVKVYQRIIQKCWFQEPIGYRSAWRYINGEYVSGAAQLLAMILCSPDVDPASLMLLAKTVMPNGNSAFLQKPDIPTYLVGSDDALTEFSRLVPAPNETYTSLLWLGDTSSVDQYLQNRRKRENEARKKR
jgi:hypothetical protein